MNEKWKFYHGSKDIIAQPVYGQGNPHNDYGLGFYCTESSDLAKEWACSSENDGFANCYFFDPKDLAVLELNNGEHHILNWLAILLENRTFRITSPAAEQARNYLLDVFKPDYKAFDIIKGYRADDSYFSFATAFLNNGISLTQLERAMTLGKLGEQIVICSRKAFDRLEFASAQIASREEFYPKKMERDRAARGAFRMEKNSPPAESDVYMLDILRERWDNNDTRLQRIVY